MSVAWLVGSTRDYYTLVASLPVLAPPYIEERPPLSRYALDRRLRMLSQEDLRELEALEDAMFFDRLPWDLPNEVIVQEFEASLVRVRSPVLREVARWRLGVRTMVSALRHRNSGRAAPTDRWGVEPWMSLMRRNWARPDLGLAHVFPWVLELQGLLRARRTRDFERLVLEKVWEHLSRLAFLRPFDFEGVALYVLRWDLVHRAALEDEAEATQRFDELLEASMEGLSLEL